MDKAWVAASRCVRYAVSGAVSEEPGREGNAKKPDGNKRDRKIDAVDGFGVLFRIALQMVAAELRNDLQLLFLSSFNAVG